jgi:hypothetical protein
MRPPKRKWSLANDVIRVMYRTLETIGDAVSQGDDSIQTLHRISSHLTTCRKAMQDFSDHVETSEECEGD